MNYAEELEAGMHPRIIHFHFSDRSTTARLREVDEVTGDTSQTWVYKGHSRHVVKGNPDKTTIEIQITSGQFRVRAGGGPHSIRRGSTEDMLTFYALSFHEKVKAADDVIVNHVDEHVCDPTGPCG